MFNLKYRLNKSLLYGGTALSFFFLSFQTIKDAGNPWQLKKEVDGIKIYLRSSPTSRLKELKTVNRFKTSLSTLVALIADKEAYPKWVYGCSKSYFIKKINAHESYHYQETKTPWPLTNRDLVVHTILRQDTISKVVTIQSTGVPAYLPEKHSNVRVPEFNACWKFTPLANETVEVEYYMSLDPGGEIPDWVVNLAVTEGPVRTLQNMEALLHQYSQLIQLSYIKE